MPSSPEMLKDWHDFYLLLGGAAATLVGLLFVAASVGSGFLTPERASASRIYMTPVIFHFTSILFVCLVVLMPSHARETHCVLISLNGVIGVVASIMVLMGVLSHSVTDWIDRLAYGAAPAFSYMGTLVAAALLFLNSDRGAELLASALVLLLLANIRNAWDMMLVMVRFRSRAAAESAPPAL